MFTVRFRSMTSFSVAYFNRSNEDGFETIHITLLLAYKLFDFLPTTLIEIAVFMKDVS